MGARRYRTVFLFDHEDIRNDTLGGDDGQHLLRARRDAPSLRPIFFRYHF